MKFSVVLAFVAAATVVSAESNGFRFARGMGPNAPVRRGTKTSNNGWGSKPSSTPTSSCGNGGKVSCCNSSGTYGGDNDDINNAVVNNLLGGIVNVGSTVGLGCDLISVTSCSQQTMCCQHNKGESGAITWDCNNLNLL